MIRPLAPALAAGLAAAVPAAAGQDFATRCKAPIVAHSIQSFHAIPEDQRPAVPPEDLARAADRQATGLCTCLDANLDRANDILQPGEKQSTRAEVIRWITEARHRTHGTAPEIADGVPLNLLVATRMCGHPIQILPTAWWKR